MSAVLLYSLLLYAGSPVICAGASGPNALDLILETENFYQGHQPSNISWEYLTSSVLELINEELDQLEAVSRNPSSLANSTFKLFEKRFEMFYPGHIPLKTVTLYSKAGSRVVADVAEVFVKPTDFVTATSKICTVSGNDPTLADMEGMVVRVCKVGKRVDFDAPDSLAYIVKFGDKCPNADKTAIRKWINMRKKARSTNVTGKAISTQLIPHLDSYHPSVLDEVQRNEIYPMISRLVQEATAIHLRLQQPLQLKHLEHTIQLFYYRFFFPGATHLKSVSSRTTERDQKIVDWLGIKVGERVDLNQVVAKCTDKTLMLSRLTGLVIEINMRVGERLPNCTFSVLYIDEKPRKRHANTPLLIDTFHGGDLETFIGYLINFTDVNGNPRTIFQAPNGSEAQTPSTPKSPLTLLLELYSYQMKRMNTTLDELQLNFISRLKLVKISLPMYSFHSVGFVPYSVLGASEDNVLCKNCIIAAINPDHLYAFLLDPLVIVD